MNFIFTLSFLLSLTPFAFSQWSDSFPVNEKRLHQVDNLNRNSGRYLKNNEAILKEVKANVLLEEDFESWPPIGWTIIDGDSSTNHWSQSGGDDFGFNGTNIAVCQKELVSGSNIQDEKMIAPSITLPVSGQPLIVRFNWLSSYSLMVDSINNADFNVLISDNNGVTWDTIFSEGDSSLVASAEISIWPWENYEWYDAFVDISAYAGSDVQIAFQYTGNDGANLYLDNVLIYELPQFDLKIADWGTEWCSKGAYHQIPWKFQMNVVNWAFVQNIGSSDLTNVSLTVDVNDGTQSIYNKTSNIIPVLHPFTTDSLGFMFGGGYDSVYVCNDPPPSNSKDYIMTFFVNCDETDEFPEDNILTYEFSAIHSGLSHKYARDNNKPGPCSVSTQDWAGHGEDGDIFGVRYDVTDSCMAYFMTFHVNQSSDTGAYVRGGLFMLTDTGNYTDLLWTDWYEITAGDLGDWVWIDFNIDGWTEWLIPANSMSYIVGLEILFNGHSLRITEDVETPQSCYSTLWKFANETEWEVIPDYEHTPFIRFYIDHHTGVKDHYNEESVRVFPNPTNGILSITNANNSKVEVYNLVGEMVYNENNFNNPIDISFLKDGSYIIKVISDEFTTTRKIFLIR